MKYYFPISLFLLCAGFWQTAGSQTLLKGKVYDRTTKEAVARASVRIQDGTIGTLTDATGRFTLSVQTGDSLVVSSLNYGTRIVAATAGKAIALDKRDNKLLEIVVSGSRTAQRRSEVPAAISTIDAQTIKDTRATRLDQLLNKATGVFMVNLGNEQHEMSIRQPLGTRSLFLYLEDGIPIRTSGIYNHNALLEMNMAATQRIEIIRGPASSLYGAEAIGGAVNVITISPPAVSSGTASLQLNNTGYKRADISAGTTLGKWGLVISGYYANRHDGPIDYSDFHKTALTVRADYKASDRTTWSNSVTYIDYYSDMTGALDSLQFARKDYTSPYSFTYRKVKALRARSRLTTQWNSRSQTQLSVLYRNNSTGQNPSYYITDDPANALLANGQINENAFSSYLLIAQHQQRFSWLNSRLIAGLSADISPSTYTARYIRIQRDHEGNYIAYDHTDSSLSDYATGINNLAAYTQYEMSPMPGLKLVGGLRYDRYRYNFRNHLPPSASSGSPSTLRTFGRLTPKVGFTYNYHDVGFYGNYSQGYVPPQVTELFNKVKVPFLKPQTFFNYEIGGWLSLADHKLYADWSLYLLNGTNEIISVKQDDGTTQNQNAGKTRHAGIEYGLNYRPSSQWSFRLSATNARHTLVKDIEKGASGNVDYSGNRMSAAPAFIANAEASWKPAFVKGLHLSLEWQRLGKYYMDNANSGRYNGFNVINLRAGYTTGHFEVWTHALNLLNKYYATIATKSAYGYSYNLGDPFALNIGVAYHFGKP
ncbi:TonB-dependent receptor [Compostibacter hankyongensis]|uniref:TonB-dependent receptor n=1 Tax=Compostibacter hankyongensis TaxID=1007089 RepID=A0ABP8FC72_9BACT